jgi:hypothetical protein
MRSSEKLKTNIEFKFEWLATSISKATFFAFETAKSFLFSAQGVRVLFSANQGIEKTIRRGFRFQRYEISFDAFTPENIKKYNVLIPLNIDDVRAISKYPDLTKDKLIPVPDLSVVNICDDKYLFNKTLTEKGFEAVIPKIGTDLPLPFFLKKKVSSAGNDCRLISNAEQKKELKDLIDSPDYFCQEVIAEKTEYATHILFKDHKIATTLSIKYTFFNRVSVNGKDDFACTEICDCDHLDTFSAILEAIGYQGLCCFDYKVIDGKPYIFEINPRFGGSLGNYFFTFLRKLESKKAA